MSPRPASTTASERRAGGRRDDSRFAHAKRIPDSRALRDDLRQAAAALAGRLDRRRPLTEDELAGAGRDLLRRVGLDERYLAFAMIAVNNVFWLEQFRAVPFSRRMLLLPRCLDAVSGDDGRDAGGAVDLFHIRARAEQLGYATLVADGTPIVVRTLAEEGMDAMLGVACLDSLESAFEKVRHLGVPAVAVPLLTSSCRDSKVELDQVAAFLELTDPAAPVETRSYLPLFRAAYRLFEEPALSLALGLEPPAGPEESASSDADRGRHLAAPHPLLSDTALVARGWLRRGGKRLRPFVTLAGYRALAGDGEIPEDLGRVALAIEAFHKASLVHDDIEDDDATRYGQPTLHRQVGVDAAINVGDYLLGLGYRLTASVDVGPAALRTPSPRRGEGEGEGQGFSPSPSPLPERERVPERAALLVRQMSDAHVRLAQGQGAELAWRRSRVAPSLADVLKIYALKTAPAFEAALTSGMILADGALSPHQANALRRFCRYVGVGFQVLNDLQDWSRDLRQGRPTVLAVIGGDGEWSRTGPTCGPRSGGAAVSRDLTVREVERARERLEASGVFEAARGLVERCRRRAVGLAAETRPEALADLLLFLTEVILRDETASPRSRCGEEFLTTEAQRPQRTEDRLG